jgi:hypothetical protein
MIDVLFMFGVFVWGILGFERFCEGRVYGEEGGGIL